MKIFVITFIVLISRVAFSQFSYTYSFGLSVNNVVINSTISRFEAFEFSPRIDYKLTSEMSFSLTSCLSVGASIKNAQYMGQAPLLGQLNFGKNATKVSEKKIGGFVGLGRAVGYYPNDIIINGMYFSGGITLGKARTISIRTNFLSSRIQPNGKFNYSLGLGIMLNGLN